MIHIVRTGLTTVVAALSFAACNVHAASRAVQDKTDDAALRRACATGALTPYVCAQHGIKTDGAQSANKSPLTTTATEPTPPPVPTAASAPSDRTPVAASPVSTPAASSKPKLLPRAREKGHAGEADVRPFLDTLRRYDLLVPVDWTLKMQGKDNASFTHGDDWIELRALPGATLQDAAAGGLQLLKAEYGQLNATSDSAIKVGGRDSKQLILSGPSKGGRPATMMVVAMPMANGMALVLMAGGSSDDFPSIQTGANAMINSIRFH